MIQVVLTTHFSYKGKQHVGKKKVVSPYVQLQQNS